MGAYIPDIGADKNAHNRTGYCKLLELIKGGDKNGQDSQDIGHFKN